MNNKCKQIQFRVLEGVSLSEEEQLHVETCMECRNFAAFAKRVDQLPILEQDVPAYLDKAILDAASAAVPTRHWIPRIWKIAVPFAAAFVFVTGVMFYQPELQEKKNLPKQSAVIAKNIVEYNLMEESFDEQVVSLAIDVDKGFSSVSESLDSIVEMTAYYM